MSEWDEWLTGRPAPTAPAVPAAEPLGGWLPKAGTPWSPHDGGPKPGWLGDETVVVNLTVNERETREHIALRLPAGEVNWEKTVAWRYA